MSDEEFSDVLSVDVNFLTEDEVRDYHERNCEEGDGWSHGFEWTPSDASILPKFGVIHLFAKENWQKIGDSLSHRTRISRSDAIKIMDLSSCGLTEESISALFGGDQTFSVSLEKLFLDDNQFGSIGIAGLIPFLRSISTLETLSLCYTSCDSQGARLLSEALNHVRVKRLNLEENDFGDDGIEYLLLAANSSNLVELHLLGNEFGRRGYEAMCNFLQRDDTMLRELWVECDEGEYAKMLVASISNKSKLDTLHLQPTDEWAMMVAPNLLRSICNLSSFESLRQSNHQLRSLGFGTNMILTSQPTITEAFDINARSQHGVSENQRLRSKLRRLYFQGTFDLQPFIGMDALLMPKVFELVTKTEVCIDLVCLDDLGGGRYSEVPSDNLDGVYRLVRNCNLAELFCFPSPESIVKDLKMKIAALEVDNAEMQQLKEENASLKLKNEQLTIEIEQYKSFALPNNCP